MILNKIIKELNQLAFISDHPLNQFKEIFNDYKIIDYQNFLEQDNLKNANIAATVLKVNERKTAKGTAYAVLKLTDLTSVFELFIFSDILNLNREILKEGNSLLLSLIKSSTDNENRFKRVNVQKISSLKDILSKPINQVTFDLKTLDEIKKFQSI